MDDDRAWPREAAFGPEGAGGEPRSGEGAKPHGAGRGAEPRYAPGTSNTRRIGPAGHDDERAKHGVAKSKSPRVVLLARRIDYLTLAFKGPLDEDVEELLCERALEVQSLQTAVAVEVTPGVAFSMALGSRDGWWYLENADARVVINKHASRGWLVAVEMSGVALARIGHVVAIERARVLASKLLARVDDERVRRVDMCADFVGFDLPNIDPHAWLAQRRCKQVDHVRLDTYREGDECTGFTIGKGAVVLRVYNKTEELKAKGDATKRAEEYARWEAAGWDGQSPVTRVEFQLRDAAMKELGLRDVPHFAERLDDAWAYCTRRWCRLVELGTRTRKKRCETDARWEAVRNVEFVCNAEPARRKRSRGTVDARHAIGAVINYTSRAGLGGGFPLGSSGREKTRDWTDEYADAWVHWLLEERFGRASRAAADELLRTAPSRREAAARLYEKVNATHARVSNLFAVDERLALEDDDDALRTRKETR